MGDKSPRNNAKAKKQKKDKKKAVADARVAVTEPKPATGPR
jgi:hypothetical protein